jgi:amino acid adenylation domain-containing protein
MLRSTALSECTDKIAIVGIGCRLPGGIESPDSLWEFLCRGGDGVRDIPADRWNSDAVYDPHPETPGKSISRRAALLDEIASFDAAFFGISPREAAVMDPQQRLLLEVTWRALEDAGIPAESLAGSRTGVYVGISHSDYHGIQQFGRRQIDVHTATGGALSIAANRLSHRFDLRGPSLAIDTACSSSLVALHIACTALLTEECDTALVGGASVILTPDVTITFSRAGMLSPDGHCKAFDSRANGYVRGEGAGMVVLKKLSRASLDHDRIHAVICSTAVNQDGHTSTITVPSRDAQVEMLRQACARANVLPSKIGYVEAHGTGTPVGDPIEASAIGTVFGEGRSPDNACIIGSIKTNIGHLEPAAGIAGLIKAALCVRRGEIPPSLHFQNPNPNIDFTKLGIRVQRSHSPWPGNSGSRIAVVNSFGFGGTNACTIVEQPPRTAEPNSNPGSARPWPVLIPVSAASKTALPIACTRLADTLEKDPQAFDDVIGTMALRRSHFDHRIVVVAENITGSMQALRDLGEGRTCDAAISGRRTDERRLAFVFTGQGSQWWGMGRGLLQRDPLAKEIIEECDRHFSQRSGWSLIEQMMQPAGCSRINETAIAQPATFALQVALAERLAEWGIKPQAVVGHSIGEIAAAYVAGALSLSQAVDVVYHRSRLQERARLQGGMAAVGLPAENARAYLEKFDGKIEVAAINGPELVTIAGPRSLIDQFISEIGRDRTDVLCQLLRVDYAFHSSQMDPFTSELRESLADLRPRSGQLPMFSTVTGQAVAGQQLDSDYWCHNMRQPVLFKQAIDQAIDAEIDTFLELGPHPSLGSAVRACLDDRNREGITIGSLHREREDTNSIASAVASLYVVGIPIDWDAIVNPDWKLIDLFGYPFEKRVHWAESEESRSARLNGPVHPLLGYRLESCGQSWQCEIDAKNPRYLYDHRIDGTVVFPAAGYIELMLAATREAFGSGPYELESVTFHEALFLGAEISILLETSLDEARGVVSIRSRERGDGTDWLVRATGRVRSWTIPEIPVPQWSPKVEPPPQVGRARFYRDLAREGHTFGPAFQGVETLWYADGCALGKIAFPPSVIDATAYLLHPAQLDSCLQVIRGFRDFGATAKPGATMAIPSRIDGIRVYRKPTSSVLFARAEAVEQTSTQIIANIIVFDDTGRLVATIEGFRCVRVVRSVKKRQDIAAEFYQERWVSLPELGQIGSPDPNGFWVILADKGGIGERLARQMVECGGQAVLVCRTRCTARVADDRFESTGTPASLRRTFGSMSRSPSHVVHLWSLDENNLPPTAVSMTRACAGVEGVLAVARALTGLPSAPRFWAVTCGGVDLDGKADSSSPVFHAALTGFLRSLGNEHPELRPTLIDLDPAAPSEDALRDEIVAGGEESEIIVRKGRRFGARLEPLSESSLPPRRRGWNSIRQTSAFRASMSSPGLIANLSLVATDRPKPAAGEVLVDVRAVGLNFRDLMAVTGLLPEGAEALPAWQHLGLECAGAIAAVGEDVDPDLIGRRVVAMTPGCLASSIVVRADAIFPIPRGLSFAAAAAIPVAFATAHYSLVTLGRLKPGERVLVHSAAGGVGLAAVSVAKACGAEILATAGSQDKRLYLHNLGIEHVFNSRSLDFADNVLWKTNGRGVDVVLNSLSGPFMEKSLSVLAGGGRFLEIGKRDIYANSALGLHAMRNNGTFYAIDLAKLAVENPALVRSEVEAVLKGLARSKLQPTPTRTFSVAKMADAFRHMSDGQHIGKLVVTIDDDEILVEEQSDANSPVAPDATYLITGGTSGLGLQTARLLTDNGARSLVLCGRSQRLTGATEAVLDALRAAGATVTVVSADVGTRAGARIAIQAAERIGLPLRGVIHAAGTIEDALIGKLNSDQIRRVFNGKVLGAWHLHELTQSKPLDFFVVFSSIAAALGSPGQAHYAAANRALNAIASIRRSKHLPATAIAFGPVSDQGYLTRRPDVRRYIESVGLQPFSAAAAMAGLETMLRHDQLDVGFAQIDWSRLAQSFSSITSSRRTSDLVQPSAAGKDGSDGQARGAILSLPETQQHGMAVDYLQRKVAAVLKVEPALVEPERRLHEMGLDSLTAFELKNRIETDLGIALPLGKFLQRPTVSAIASTILDNIRKDVRSEGDAAETETIDLEMSVGQQALWFINRLDPGNPAYALASCVSFRPHLNDDYIDEIIESIVSRYENLRVAFPSDGIGPVPTLLPAEHYRLRRHDLSHLGEEDFSAVLTAEANKPFDLEADPLSRLHLFRRSDRDVLLLQFHHIVADAASIAILLDEMVEGYFALQAGMPLPGKQQRAHFGQFTAWQQALISGSAGEQHRSYWRKQLAGAPASLPIATDHPRTANALGSGAARNFTLKAVVVKELKGLARSEGTTLFSILMAAFNVLLHRYSGASDIVVGTPMSGRTRPEFERTVGYLVNALPIRTRLLGAQSFQSLLSEVDANVRGALEHQDCPFATIVQDLDPPRDPGCFPIFQIIFGMERFDSTDPRGMAATLLNIAGPAITYREFTVESVAVARSRAPVDITFTIEEFDDQIFGVVDYRSDLWEERTIARIVDDYRAILHQIVVSPLCRVSDFVLSGTAGKPICGPELTDLPDVVATVSNVAARTPDAVAITDNSGDLSYAALLGRARRLARALSEHKIGAGARVGICLQRNRDLPVAMLAVLITRAAYVPLDPSYPKQRLATIITDATPSIILVDERTRAVIPEGSPVRLIEDSNDTVAPLDPAPLQDGDLAYIIHTSGSTGRPTGVEIGRGALANFLAAMRLEIPLSSNDALLAVTPYCFDISILELLLPLTVGARVVIADEAVARDGRKLSERLGRGDITVMQATPATWQMLMECDWKGSPQLRALCGGEALQSALAAKILARTEALWNLYGPTETTIWSTCAQIVEPARAVPIGRPLANTICFIVDESLKPVAAGTAGELLIGGAGLARGYHNDPVGTASRFICDPQDPGRAQKFFRTGDFVRLRPDGTLQFLGRRDQQVKIRGFRVELGEVEAALHNHPTVREAAVVSIGDDLADRRLVAFVVADGGADTNAEVFGTYLRGLLPPYMVPDIRIVAGISRLPNGKADRQRLAAQAAIQTATASNAAKPTGPIETRLVALLKELLGHDRIGINDNFFSLGGTSLLGMRYLTRINSIYSLNLGAADLMRAPTIGSMGQLIAGNLDGKRATAAHEARERPTPQMREKLWRPLPMLRAEGSFDAIDAAAIAYLPDDLLEAARCVGIETLLRHQLTDAGEARWAAVCRSRLGTIALVVVPRFGNDLIADPSIAVRACDSALEFAVQLGATTAALTGLIPAVTDFGRALRARPGLSITTGHATTASAVVLTAISASEAVGRKIHGEAVAFVGLGAIGTATLRLMLDRGAIPRRLILCDVPAKAGELEHLAEEIRSAFGYRGALDVALAVGSVPPEIYQCRLIIGATNMPGVLDVKRLAAGTIVVDDSFPHCFDSELAIHRMTSQKDVLLVDGGFVLPREPIEWTLALPENFRSQFEALLGLNQIPLQSTTAITGCILSALLSKSHGATASVGPVGLEACREHWDVLARLGIGAAPLRCGSWLVPETNLASFRDGSAGGA